MKKVLATIIALALITSACSPFSAEQRDAVRAFGDLLEVLPPEGDGQDDAYAWRNSEDPASGYWRVVAPDRSVWFEWDNQCIAMGVEMGLPTSAGSGEKTQMLLFMSPAYNMLNLSEQATALAQFEKDAVYIRDRIGYIFSTDRYYIDIEGLGNRIEFARDINTNDKDIVFVISVYV